jgi:endoglucanase
VAIGDPITFRLEMVALGNDLVTSPAFDNKCGTFIVMEALRLCSTKKLRCGLFAVSTVRGATTSCFGVDPHVGIAVDVTHATDYPDIDKRTNGDVKVGAGPTISTGANINPRLGEMLIATAKAKRIPHQREGAPGGTGTDANAMQLTRAGVATALIGIPNRYMHTPVEIVSLSDLENAAKLIAETVAKIDRRTSFIPE